MIKVAAVQMGASTSAGDNLRRMKDYVVEACTHTPDLDVIVFPEYCYYEPHTAQDALDHALTVPGPLTDALAELAVRYHVNIVSGSFAEKAPGGKMFNSVVFIDRSGRILANYHKIHLMVGMNFDESEYVEFGDHVCVFDTDFGRVGMMVCYDLRFPELARTMVLNGADVIFVSSCFPSGSPLPPRTDHWDILTQSTALLNLTYTVASNQFGSTCCDNHFGRSCIVDPWGIATAKAAGGECIVYGELDLEYQRAIRENMRAILNRRPELYDINRK